MTANHAADESTSEAIRGVMAALGDYRMPALLLLSGILLPRSLTKPTGVFISGKLRLIAWPCLVWSAVMLGIFGPELGLTWRWWLLAEPSHVWYLNALLMYYLLGLLLRRVPPLVTALALLALSVPLAVFSYPGDVPGMVWHRPWYGFFFFLGAALQPHLNRVIGLRGWVIALATLASVPWVVHTVRVSETFNGGVVAALMSAVGLIVVVWLAPRVPRGRVARAFEWMGRNSIVIYLVHFPSMFAWHQIGFSADGVLNYLVMVALSLGAGVVAVRLRPWSWSLYEFPDLRARRRRRREAAAAAG